MKYATPKMFYEEAIVSTIHVPPDLVDLIKRSKRVKRYEDSRYPEGMIEDTLYKHLCRLASLAHMVCPYRDLKPEVMRTVWIHDLPEILLGDQTAVLKSEGLVRLNNETETAKRILSRKDFELYKYEEQSADFLRGKGDAFSPAGLMVKILDALDGNIFFHKYVSAWVRAGNHTLPPDSALEYTFSQHKTFQKNTTRISDNHLRQLLNMLLDWEILQIRLMWEDGDVRIPAIIRTYLSK